MFDSSLRLLARAADRPAVAGVPPDIHTARPLQTIHEALQDSHSRVPTPVKFRQPSRDTAQDTHHGAQSVLFFLLLGEFLTFAFSLLPGESLSFPFSLLLGESLAFPFPFQSLPFLRHP